MLRTATRRALLYPAAAADAADYVGPLDGISNIEAAYSVRRLLSSYTGSLVRLRRDSDDAESDFGFDGSGDLDTAAIATWLGAATGYATVWYDQSGNGYDVAQALTANQPDYKSSVAGLNSNPTLHGVNDAMLVSSISQAVRFAATVANWDTGTNLIFPTWAALLRDGTSYYIRAYGGDNRIIGPDSEYMDGVLTDVFAPMSTHKIITALLPSATLTSIQLFNESGARPWTGDCPEMILLSSLPSTADHNAIGSNQATYYGMTWTTVT